MFSHLPSTSRPDESFIAVARDAFRRSGRVVVALSPSVLSAELVDALPRDEAFWSGTHVFLCDTRRNGLQVAELRAMLERLPVRADRLRLAVLDEPDAVRAASAYEQELRAFFRLRNGELPAFDAVVLGRDRDGEVPALASGGHARGEIGRLALASYCPVNRCYVTLSAPVVLNARAFIVTCADLPHAIAAQAGAPSAATVSSPA